jgi:hypothetical protein
VVVADRDPPAGAHPGVEACVSLDVTDRRQPRRALARRLGHDRIAALPLQPAAMEGALAAGAHYVDLGGLFHMTRPSARAARDFERRRLMAILGIGSAPGILNVLAARGAASARDRVPRSTAWVGAADRPATARRRSASATRSNTLLDEFAMPSAIFRAGGSPWCRRSIPASASRCASRRRSAASSGHDAPLPRSRRCRSISASRGDARGHIPPGLRFAAFMERLTLLVSGLADCALRAPPERATRASRTTPSPRRASAARSARAAAEADAARRRESATRCCARWCAAAESGPADDRHAVDCIVVGPRAGSGVGPDIDTGAPPSIAGTAHACAARFRFRPGRVGARNRWFRPRPSCASSELRGMRVVQRRDRS